MLSENKLVIIVNEEIRDGVAMNAIIAHMALGLGAVLGTKSLGLYDYVDGNGNINLNTSQMPVAILRAKPNEIKKIINYARKRGLKLGIFTNTVTGGTYRNQLVNTKDTSKDNLMFYGAALFGEWDQINMIAQVFLKKNKLI